MAVERLHELVDDGAFDVIVLDTPPSHNALDFLDAPARIIALHRGARAAPAAAAADARGRASGGA